MAQRLRVRRKKLGLRKQYSSTEQVYLDLLKVVSAVKKVLGKDFIVMRHNPSKYKNVAEAQKDLSRHEDLLLVFYNPDTMNMEIITHRPDHLLEKELRLWGMGMLYRPYYKINIDPKKLYRILLMLGKRVKMGDRYKKLVLYIWEL